MASAIEVKHDAVIQRSHLDLKGYEAKKALQLIS